MEQDVEIQKAAERVGQLLHNKWLLERVLGVGGMAAVYAGRHRNGQRAAIKVLHAELAANVGLRQRFLREGYVANAVEHSCAVVVLDDDVAPDGSVFLVMELLDGENLEERRVRLGSSLPVLEVLAIADQLLDALAAAHAKGIIHRDIKPENLFVLRNGRLKVLDFGIARVQEASEVGPTRAGTILGSPAFMPPEQALGRVDEIDARTDLWAVGATMFALLSGRCVHEGQTGNEVLLKAMTARAPSLGDVAAGHHPFMIQLVDRALAWERHDRFPDARSMRQSVMQVLELFTLAQTVVGRVPRTSQPEIEDSAAAGFDRLSAPVPALRPAPIPNLPAIEAAEQPLATLKSEVEPSDAPLVESSSKNQGALPAWTLSPPTPGPRDDPPTLPKKPASETAADDSDVDPDSNDEGATRLMPSLADVQEAQERADTWRAPAAEERPSGDEHPRSGDAPPSAVRAQPLGGSTIELDAYDVEATVNASNPLLAYIKSRTPGDAEEEEEEEEDKTTVVSTAQAQELDAHPSKIEEHEDVTTWMKSSAIDARRGPPAKARQALVASPLGQPGTSSTSGAVSTVFPEPPQPAPGSRRVSPLISGGIVLLALTCGFSFVFGLYFNRRRAAESASWSGASGNSTHGLPASSDARIGSVPNEALGLGRASSPGSVGTRLGELAGPPPSMVSGSSASAAAGAEAVGYLSIVCRPFCDSALVNGQLVGFSPLKTAFPAGKYQAVLKRKGVRTKVVPVEILPGQTTQLVTSLDDDPEAVGTPEPNPYRLTPTLGKDAPGLIPTPPDAAKAGCVPKRCEAQGFSCGPLSDGCGKVLDCGDCKAPDTCGGGGKTGVCGHNDVKSPAGAKSSSPVDDGF